MKITIHVISASHERFAFVGDLCKGHEELPIIRDNSLDRDLEITTAEGIKMFFPAGTRISLKEIT